MKQTTINVQITKNLGNYENVRLGGEWTLDGTENTVQSAYSAALNELNSIFEQLYHKKDTTPQNEQKAAVNEKQTDGRQVVEFGTSLLQKICNRITSDKSVTLEQIEKYYILTEEARKTVALALKMR